MGVEGGVDLVHIAEQVLLGHLIKGLAVDQQDPALAHTLLAFRGSDRTRRCMPWPRTQPLLPPHELHVPTSQPAGRGPPEHGLRRLFS